MGVAVSFLVVRPSVRWLGQVADRAGGNRPSISLQGNGLLVIPGLAGGQDSMCAVIATFTIQSAMTGGQPVQGTGIFLVLAAVTIAAARLILL